MRLLHIINSYLVTILLPASKHFRRSYLILLVMAAPISFLLSLFLLILCYPHVNTMVNAITNTMLCHEYERSALLHFKQTLTVSSNSSAYLKTASWKTDNNSDCCSWDGVECDEDTGYVISLDLSSSSISGTFHSNSTLFSLVHLQNLNLADNNFKNSSIPPEISNLSSLSFINFSHSSFSGQIPLELSGVSKLTSLDLSNNSLNGAFPIGIFDLANLLVLNVSDNQNLTGYLPVFNHTSSLRELELVSTSFSGNVPASIENLQSLTKLRLGRCNFSGSIPASIGNLTQLTFLSFSYNKFKAGKLFWLDKLTKLERLYLKDTNLYGEIPSSLANLTKLTTLHLQTNHFTGEIPYWLLNMTELTDLRLSSNQLTGPISSSFSQLINLETLNLQYNNFSGTVEADIFLSLEKLTFLSLSKNNISLLTHNQINSTLSHFIQLDLDFCNLGEIPSFLQYQDKLETLLLTGNNIHGLVPAWLWNASDTLVTIDLSHNILTGMGSNSSVLPGISLVNIDISKNILKGNLPIPPRNVMSYHADNNYLTGEIPYEMCGLRSLQILHLFSNNMTGPIPWCLANSLSVLNIGGNNFSGTIAQSYSGECNLKVMDLSQNKLEGQLPRSLSNCRMLHILDLGDNQLEDTFPFWLGTLPQLQVLVLHANRFWGATASSPEIGLQFPMLRIIDVSQNSFTGDLPLEYIQKWSAMKFLPSDMELYTHTITEFQSGKYHWTDSYSSSLTLRNKGVTTEYTKILNIFCAIDFSSNRFTGKIPDSFGSLKGVQLLNLANNELTGPIPPSLGNLRQLESLDFSVNKLSGAIPHQIAAQLNFLSFFNVSYNLLRGPIPQGPQFSTFENTSYMGNPGLCGFPLSKKCAYVQSPAADNEDDDDSDEFLNVSEWAFIIAGVGSGLVIGFVLGNKINDRHPRLILKVAKVLT